MHHSAIEPRRESIRRSSSGCRAATVLCAVLLFMSISTGAADARQEPAMASTDTIRGTIHVVQKGDTLWELCEKYMDNARLWPTVHRANEQTIANPHLIYPGQRIWFPIGRGTPVVLSFEEVWPDRETGLLDVARQAQNIPIPDVQREQAAGQEQAAGGQEAVRQEEQQEETGAIPGVVVGEFREREEVYYPLASGSAILAAGFIGNPGSWPDGQIIEGEGVDLNMSLYAQVFLDVGENRASIGDLFIVVEAGDRVRHPEWGHGMGRKIFVKGIIRIVDVEARTSQGVLIAVFHAVGRKDRVIPAPEVDSRPWKDFVPVQGGRSGFVVARAKSQGNLHPYDMIFIDGGNEEGVQVGDLYVLKRPHTERGRLRFYEEELARATVIAVEEKTATLMILTLKTAEISAGEKVELIGRSVFADTSSVGGGEIF